LFPLGAVGGQESAEVGSLAEISVARFPVSGSEQARYATTLSGPVRSGAYLGTVSPYAAWLGRESGEGEVWIHPLKVASKINLSFKIPQYLDPIPGRVVASSVEVRPGFSTITYSHAGFQVREHILAPRDLPGILILLEADPVVELEILVQFQPVLQYAWPGGLGGQYLYWDEGKRVFVLSESLRNRNAVVGSPWISRASAHPAHRLAEAPSSFVISVDPARSRNEYIPIAIAGGISPRENVEATYRQLLEEAEELHRRNRAWAEALQSGYVMARGGSPSASYDLESTLEWAKVNLAEQRTCNPDLGCGLVAGWGPSGTSLRPGFGWYFGGDASINSLAMDATGQWDDVAEGLRFLARFQRDDGKIPHEISQAAGQLPWFDEYPYAYYHADTTPFWILALWYYWRATADRDLVQELWPALEKAFGWCLSVETDGDGIIENTTGGLGAIEVGGLGEGLHQDIYLAAVWITAARGVVEMAESMESPDLLSRAASIVREGTESLNRLYWIPEKNHHAFGILRSGGTNDNLTAWPGTALAFGLLDESEAEGTLRQLSTDAIASTWGARLLSTGSSLYDPLHYNNGAVWPFMTGFVAWGQYRYRRPWAGYPLVQALFNLTDDWGLGRHPENLSGAFYQTMDATVPHQFFASSMVATSFLRGLLGWDPDAPHQRASLSPQPPPSWPTLSVTNLRVGESRVAYQYHRLDRGADVRLSLQGPAVELKYVHPVPLGARNLRVEGTAGRVDGILEEGLHDSRFGTILPLSNDSETHLHLTWEGGLEASLPDNTVEPGERSGGLRILDFRYEDGWWVLLLEGDAGTSEEVEVWGEAVATDDAEIVTSQAGSGITRLKVSFQEGEGRATRTVRLRRTG
jgi:glycogen debranching enzyme